MPEATILRLLPAEYISMNQELLTLSPSLSFSLTLIHTLTFSCPHLNLSL